MGEDTCLLAHVAMFLYIDILYEIFSPHTFYSLREDTFNISSFIIISVLVTRTHAKEYSTDYSWIFVMFPFSCISWYIHLILFVLNVLLYASFHIFTWECPPGVMVKAMDCGIVIREFVLQSSYYVHFRANTLGKGMNSLILPAVLQGEWLWH